MAAKRIPHVTEQTRLTFVSYQSRHMRLYAAGRRLYKGGMEPNLKRQFADRAALVAYVREQFPNATHPDQVSAIRGGRKAAQAAVAGGDLSRYDRTRNYLDGDVTRLSPYIRHGVIHLAELRDYAQKNGAPDKFINELGWRDYYQRAYARWGRRIWDDLEPYKTGFNASDYADVLPDDIVAAETGTCMDIFIRDLYATGYLHNHARMWLAAYVVHWRRIKWQAGARWFLQHLLDGDPASNNLSWQWVASTFSHKPYFFNADNVRKFGRNAHRQLRQGRLDPFEGSYPELERKLFPNKPPDDRSQRGKKRR